ncbi:MAG: serine hydrolase [Patescibacteria group bacterium]|nr:serine hydrolase [Patescibacteria group bacterium]MDQ5970835.1 serine hydrolase [Patescibacteria group bacterium]
MKKRVFLIHGWDGSPDKGWRPWLKKELEANGFEVQALALPNPRTPELQTWLDHINNSVGQLDNQCYFVCHSLGNITILRYLESLAVEKKIGGVVMVAGFCSNLGYKELASFFPNQGWLDWDKIKSHCDKFVAIHSDNDPFVSTHYGEELFQKYLGAKYILEHDKKHFGDNDNITELPSALEAILEMTK